MGRLFGGYYSTEDVADFGSGAIVASAPETAILKNINWLHARMVPTLAVDVFGFEAGDPWLDVSTGNDSAITIVATYRIRVPKDFATYRIKVRCKNAHASSAGTLAAGLSSNGASVTTAIAAGSTGATLSMDLAINTSTDRETINIGIQNGSSDSAGVCSIQSVSVYVVPLTSPLTAGKSTQGFIPLDTGDAVTGLANEPMSTHFRNTMLANLDTLTKKRGASQLVSWSDNADNRTVGNFLFKTTGSAYVPILRVPVWVPHGFSKIEWSLQGYTTAGSGGQIKLVSNADPTGVESAAFVVGGWTAGAQNTAEWQDNNAGGAGLLELDAIGNAWDTITVSIKGGGSGTTYLTALSIWIKEAT